MKNIAKKSAHGKSSSDTSLLAKYNRFNVWVRPCEYGRGVFAGQDFKKGDLIEVCPLIVLTEHEADMAWAAHSTTLEQYYYDYDYSHSALALGYGSLYNHRRKPNAHYSINKKVSEVVIYSCGIIKKDSQIFLNYGYDPVKKWAKYT